MFRCTKKVQEALGLKERDLYVGAEHGSGDLREWYSNLVIFDRRKCLVFTHAVTLYSFMVPGVKKADFARFGEVFRSALKASLGAEGFSARERERLVGNETDIFGKATDRGVLGSMNDHVRTLGIHIDYEGGLDRVRAEELNHYLNETPMSRIGMQHSTLVLKTILRTEVA